MKSARLTVQSDEQAVKDTKLYAPQTGTIVSLSGEVGETVSARGRPRTPPARRPPARAPKDRPVEPPGRGPRERGFSSSSSSSSSSGSTFAVLSDLAPYSSSCPCSESEIGSVGTGSRDGHGRSARRPQAGGPRHPGGERSHRAKAASSPMTSPSSSTRRWPGLKPGMSATAEVVVKQAEGVNVPSGAITGCQ